MDASEVTSSGAGAMGVVGAVVLLVLVIAAILMPLYVIQISWQIASLKKIMQRQLEELAKIRQRWDA